MGTGESDVDCSETIERLYHYLDGERMKNSGALVQGPWRYEEVPGASHWVPLDAPGRLNELLLDWLR